MKYFSHLNSAVEIINLYFGQQPFHLFIKDFFSQNKKYGAKDRKSIAHLCYCFFRLAKILQDKPRKEKIVMGLFLCSEKSNEVLQILQPEWNEHAATSIKEKCLLLNVPYHTLIIFPFQTELSDGIEKEVFNLSHLHQPDVFIRIRPGYKDVVIKKMEQAAVAYSMINDGCIAVSNSIKIDKIVNINKEVVVQDYSSQRISEFLQLIIDNSILPIKVWDCCAASGGKSILAKDVLRDINLTVSDVRESILINLKKRFNEAGVSNFKTFIADITKPVLKLKQASFNLIIADVPCSGSGTWGRTPEQLSYFNENRVDEYSSLQKKLITNIIPHLNDNGYLLYITCSVFKKENEEIVHFIQKEFQLELIKMEVLKGYAMKADTMFAALFIKNNTVAKEN